MRKPSGELHIIDFSSQQVIASIKPSEYLTDLRHWELRDNIDTLDVTFLERSKYAPYMQQQNIIVKETRPGVLVPYVITEVEKDTTDKTITVFASGEWTLMGADDFIKPQTFSELTPEQYIDFATKNTDWERGIVEVTGKRTMTAKEFVSPLGLLSQLPGLFEKKGELRYRIELRGANTMKRKVDFIERRGRDTGKEITVGKDLNSITRTENSEAIITALLPYVMGEDEDGNEKIITIETVNSGVPYIVDADAFQRWNRNGKHRFGFYTPETDNKDMTPARLLQLAKTELKKRVDTIVSYDVNAYDISRIPGFEHESVNEGDTIYIKDPTLNPPLYLEARVIAGDESHKDNRATKYKFGNYREIADPNAELRRLYQRILSSLQDKVPKDVFDDLANRVGDTELTAEEALKRAEQAEKEAKASQDITNKVIEDLKNYQTTIIEQPTAPTSPPHKLEVNKTLWLDSSNPAKKILKIYRGNNTWERIVPDTSQTEKDLAKLIQDVGTIQGEVDQLQADALKTQEDIKNIGVEVNKKVDQTWLTEEMKKKANTEDVYTKDYVDKNLVGQQTYNVDKQANIKAFQDMNTKYDQTAEAIKLTATKDELKQTNQNVTNVTQTVSEVKITAEENSKKITKVEGDFKNMQIGSVNLALDTEFICDVKNATANYSSLKTLKTSTKVNYRNKKLTMSFILTGNITGKGTSPWMGAELVVKYVDGSPNDYLSMRRDASPVGSSWVDSKQSAQFTIKDKEIALITITAGARDVFGNFKITNLQLEEGTVATSWKPATEEAVSTGDFKQVTNEIKQTVEANTATIQKIEGSFVNANLLVTSSANKEYPEIAGDVGGHQASRSTMTFENDYIKLISTDGTDSFYQIGSYRTNDLRGMTVNRDYTFSADLVSNTGTIELVLFESNGTGWNETKKTVITTGPTSFVRGAMTFKLQNGTKGFILRVRFPMSANSTGKYMCFKNAKLEDGSISTRWTPASVNEGEFTKTTNEIKQTTEENSQTITKLVTKGNLGDNLIFNSDLSQRDPFPIGWTYTNKTDIFYQEPWVDDKRAGVFRIARTNLPANSPNSIISAYSKMFPVTINTDYTFSVYIKIPQFATFVGDRAFIIEFFDDKGVRVEWQDITMTKAEIESAKANKWTRIVRTMATKNATATQGGIRLALFNNGEIFYRMPQAELGSMATGWGLASSDFVSDQSFTKTTNEIKQGLEENSQTITKVEKKVNDIKVGAENLFLASEKPTVLPPKDTGNGADNYNYASIPVEMQMDREYTISARVKFTTAPPLVSTKISVYPYTNGVATAVDIKDGYIFHTFKKTNVNTKSVLLYAGIAGSTKGIGVEFAEIMVTEGNQPVAYAPSSAPLEEFSTYKKTTNEIKQTTEENSQIITKVTATLNGGGNNLLSDARIEDASKWMSWAGVSIDDTIQCNGYNSMRSIQAGNTALMYRGLMQTNVPFEVGGNYVFTFQVYTDNVASFDDMLGVEVICERDDGTRTTTYRNTTDGKQDVKPTEAGKWFKHTLIAKNIPVGTTKIRIGVRVWKNGRAWISNPQWEAGELPTTFKPAPVESASLTKQNEIKQTVDKNSQTITSLSTTQGKQGELIQKNVSAIEQLDKQISLRVTETQMEDYIGKLGTTNQFLNAPFEVKTLDAGGNVTTVAPSLDKWRVNGVISGVNVQVVRSITHGGNWSTIVDCQGLTTSKWAGISQDVSVVKNAGDYVLSAWVYTDNVKALDKGFILEVRYFNGKGTASLRTDSTNVASQLKDNAWTFVSFKVTVPNIDLTHMEPKFYVTQNGTVWIAQPQFQQGSEPSTFMPNPRDITNYKEMVDLVGSKVAQSDYDKKIATYDTQFTQTSKALELKAVKEEVYTKAEANGAFGEKAMVIRHEASIQTQAEEISLRVKKGDIASTINQTAQSVLIQAQKINLVGAVTADSIKSGKLEGTLIQTAPAGSGANHIRLNAQNMTLYGSGQARGYLGFINRTDSNITSALVLGNDYTSAGSLDGSLVLDQTTITGNQWTNSVASIGIATGRNGNDILKKSYINFYRYNGNMDIRSEGSMELLTTNGSIEIDASSSGATTGFLSLKASKDIDMVAKRGQYRFFTSDNLSMPAMTLVDRKPTSSGDVDLTIANLIMFRMARDISYVGDGIQLKDATGSNFRDMKLRTLRATENISSVGRMWAQEFIPTSSRKLKTDIKDLSFSALDKINSVNIKQYHFIRDVERFESGESITLPINYGMIAEDSDDVFTTPQKDAVTLYSTVSISLQAIQELDFKVKNLHFDQGMVKQEVDTLKEQLEAEKLEKEDLAKRVEQLEALVQQFLTK
ncbi:phage tail spike protein [Bacillus paranthracis]|uniref:phage tail spike protein n=1 Tax=Bacillus paranthracis TaxID=2026186 RepID=UPI003D654A20